MKGWLCSKIGLQVPYGLGYVKGSSFLSCIPFKLDIRLMPSWKWLFDRAFSPRLRAPNGHGAMFPCKRRTRSILVEASEVVSREVSCPLSTADRGCVE